VSVQGLKLVFELSPKYTTSPFPKAESNFDAMGENFARSCLYKPELTYQKLAAKNTTTPTKNLSSIFGAISFIQAISKIENIQKDD
jgi:hypothetical protein